MDKNEMREVIAKRAAKELHDGDVVNLGIGIPTLIPNYLPEGVTVTLQTENGAMGMGPTPEEGKEDKNLINAGGGAITLLPGACTFDSATSFAIIRGGHVNVSFLGALQVDEKGNLANWIIPGKMAPGMGGAMDLVVGAKRVILTMEHTQKGAPKILKECTLPLTAAGQVNMIITEMGVMDITPEGIVVREIHPEFTFEQMQAATEAKGHLIPADMDYSFLKIEQHDQITVMKVSAPKSLNALNSTVLKEIDDFVSNLDTKQTRVLIITGDGEKAFVAGADISEMVHLYEKEGYEFSKLGAIAFRKIETLPIPVIAAVNGFCLGGGCELAMACDFRYASSKAKFGQPEVGLGITPGFSGTYRLAKLVGQGYAKEMIYTGKAIRADEALRIGLVNAVYEPEELMDKVMETAQKMVANAPLAIAYAKQCINESYDLIAADAIELENTAFGKCFATEDQKEGMTAFLEKRPATFKGK